MPQVNMFDAPTKPKSRWHKKPEARHVLGDISQIIPDDIPAHWIVCNAPRPLYGDRKWEGPFFSGVFYIAIDPDGELADLHLHRTAEMNGKMLVIHSEDWLFEYGLEWYRQTLPEYYARIELEDKQHRRMVIDRALKELNKSDED